MNILITRNTATGELIASDDRYERDDQLNAAHWADADCEDVGDHPVYVRQLATLRRLDKNGYCDLTDKPFTSAQLAAAVATIEGAAPNPPQSQHTPGPWRLDATGPANACVVSSGGDLLAIGAQGTSDKDEDEANLRLMASAPDLLDCLNRLVDDLTEAHEDELNSDHNGDGPDCSYCRNIARARAAIAKATGGAK